MKDLEKHNLGENGLVINLMNACSIANEERSALEKHSCSNSNQSTESSCPNADGISVSTLDDKQNEERKKNLSQVQCNVSHNDVGVLFPETPQNNPSELCGTIDGIMYEVYESEKQMPDIMRLITKDLSEPYSIYTYRYFIHNWPKLCFLAMADKVCVGAIVCKLDLHKKMVRRGYIAMLAVDSEFRRRQIGSSLVTKAIEAMIRDECDEVVLETEITNQAALHLYENLGFVRDKRLFRYYLNGVDALRLKLWLR
ncbi:N-alpha-acetyltransferase 30-like isoform X1 [Physella acuta]|uniref:N-alpha-acetyltransferase 30-like isoform X1 n=1 Tax=Physella acuta TaxID=109671 RepID=UPI0027DE66C0|nr:N-alpha-acetyltransferase 30-like isoform X1 [Physella acuta]